MRPEIYFDFNHNLKVTQTEANNRIYVSYCSMQSRNREKGADGYKERGLKRREKGWGKINI